MRTDYCGYRPRIAVDVEINQQRDGDRAAFIIGTLLRLAAISFTGRVDYGVLEVAAPTSNLWRPARNSSNGAAGEKAFVT